MKNNNFTSLLIILLFVATLMAVIGFMRKTPVQDAKAKSEEKTNTVLRDINAQMWDNYVSYIIEDDYKKISDSSILKDTTGKIFTPISITKGKSKIIFRFSFKDCDMCINKVLDELKQLAVDKSDFIIIEDNYSFRDFLVKSQTIKHEVKNLTLDNGTLGLYMENKNFPFLFVLSPELKVSKLFIPAKENPEQIRSYLKKVLTFVKEENAKAE